MVGENTVGLSTLLFLAAPVCYLLLVRRLDRRQAHQPVLSDEAYITVMARMRECSEYDIFNMACDAWNAPKGRVDLDFKDDLINGYLPHYVKDSVRKVRRL